MGAPADPTQIGLVFHPVRDVSEPLDELRAWAHRRGVALVQVAVPGMSRRLAPEGEAGDCDLIVSVGGDGTMLAASRIAMAVARPVLGIGCGSLGVLARVAPGQIGPALDRFAAGDWSGEALPGLHVDRAGEPGLVALNDLSILRDGIGQIRVAVHVDGVLYARIAGDGVIAATALGSSAYSLAAGGPLLGPGVEALLLTPLPTHGGAIPPLVVGGQARVAIDVDGGYGGARLELDGQIVTGAPRRLELSLRPAAVALVAFDGQAPAFDVLRDRQIVLDSPRIRAEDRRRTRTARHSDS